DPVGRSKRKLEAPGINLALPQSSPLTALDRSAEGPSLPDFHVGKEFNDLLRAYPRQSCGRRLRPCLRLRPMNPFRFHEPLSRDAPTKTGVFPPRLSRERDLLAPSCGRMRLEDAHERSADAARRRREQYAAAVVLSGAITAALTGTVWARGSSGDAD